jgi:hypothetical protein
MPFYRIYPLTPAGRVSPPVDAECADDAAAIVTASLLEDKVANGCEVWELTRFLGRFHFKATRPPTPIA